MSTNSKKGAANVDQILNNANSEQLLIMERWSKLVGKVLSNIEIALPEGKQYLMLKRVLNDIIYNSRNNLLVYFNMEVSSAEAKDKIMNEIDAMTSNIGVKLDMSFPQRQQQQAVKISVNEAIHEIVDDLLLYFVEE